MTHSILKTCSLASTLLLFFVAASAQVSEKEARDLTRKAVIAAIPSLEPDAFLEITRNIDLERDFVRFSSKRNIVRPSIFRVTDVGDEERDHVVIHHVPSPELQLYVVVSDAGDVFTVFRKDYIHSIKVLAHAYQVSIDDESEARDYAVWCFTIAILSRLQSCADLQRDARLAFKYSSGSDAKAQTQFARWWNEHKRQVAALSFGGSVAREGKGFLVRFVDISTSTSNHQPQAPSLIEPSLHVSHNGEIGSLRIRKVD